MNLKLFHTPMLKKEGASVEAVAREMRLLRALPGHEQTDETRGVIEDVRRAFPDVVVTAELLVMAEFVREDNLVEHPEECPRCHGSGKTSWNGLERVCGCPAGERRLGRTPLTTHQILHPEAYVSQGEQFTLLPEVP